MSYEAKSIVIRHQQVHQGLEDFISLQGVKTRACLDFMFGLEDSLKVLSRSYTLTPRPENKEIIAC